MSMIKGILNRFLSVSGLFDEERIFDKGNFIFRYPYEKDKARYLFVKKFLRGGRVLDMACGKGHGTAILSRNNGHSVYGLDRSTEAISFAKESFGDKNICFREGDVYNTGFEDNFFTSVVSIETIEHLDDHDRFLTEIKRILKRGGILLLSSPDKITKDRFFDNPHHINLLYKEEMLELLNRYFEVVDVYCQGLIIKRPVFMASVSFILFNLFLSTAMFKERACFTGTNCIFICKTRD